MANNEFLDSLGISNITTNEEGNYYNSYEFTLYYRIRRSQILWEYTNPDIKAIVYFSDGTSYSPGWKTKQGDSGNYKYEGDDGIGNYTISLSSSYFKTITSIELQARKSSSTSGEVGFNKIFSFEEGKKFYTSIYFYNKEVREIGEFTLKKNNIEPKKQIMTTSTLPEIIGENQRGVSSKLFFGDKIKIFRPSTFTYLGKSNLSPTKIQLSARNVGSENFNSIGEPITAPAKNTTINNINNLLDDYGIAKHEQIEFQAIFYVGENGTYTYTTIMYWVEALNLYLDTSNLSIRPNKIVKENMDNDNSPFDIKTNISGTIKIKEELKENSFPFSIKTIQCITRGEDENGAITSDEYTIFDQSTSNFVNLDFTSTEIGNIIEPTNITLIFTVVPFLSSESEKDYIYTYDVSQISPENKVISLRGIQYSIPNIYNNKSFRYGKPIVLTNETISFSCSTTKTIYNPNIRDWEQDASINSKMEFYIDGFKLEEGQYTQNNSITQTVEKILVPKYVVTEDKILIENVYSDQASIRLGRTQKIKFANAYIQDQQLNYILSDNGGDQSSEISSTQYLEDYSSLYRGESQTLTINFYSNDGNQVSGTVEIASLDDAKKCFKENNKNTLSLSEINSSGLNLENIIEISFTYNGINSEQIEITIKGKNPTLSFRKNGLIINGQPNQQLEGNDFIEINALSTDKTISIKYLGDDGTPISIGQIAFENNKIVLKNIYISSSYILDS